MAFVHVIILRASLVVTQVKNLWHCFGCGAAGGQAFLFYGELIPTIKNGQFRKRVFV
jgi:hypothetical protein